MVKNIVSSDRSEQIHVNKRRHPRRKIKIMPMDDDRNPLRFYSSNIVSTSTWGTGTSGADLSLQQDKKTANYEDSRINSINHSKIYNTTNEKTFSIDRKNNGQQRKYVDSFRNQSHSYCRNFTCKSTLIVLAVCLLGLFVIAALILPNVLLYLMLPIIFQSPSNQSNLTESIIYANHCGGVSPYTQWAYYNTGGIYMQINTANCSFSMVPLYYTSITGDSLQDDLTGSSAIYSPSKTGFRIYCQSHSGWSGSQMLNYSQIEEWNVNWIGIYY